MSAPRSSGRFDAHHFRASLSLTSDRVNKVFKILILGDAGSGKTSLIKQYVYNQFEENTTAPTVGVDFVARQLKWDENVRVNLQIWDIPGSQRGSVITSTFYNFAMGALLVYDASIPNALESLLEWKEDVNSRICLPNGEFIPYVILANKCDLEASNVDGKALDQFVQENGFVGWFETSAKTGQNIDEAVKRLVSRILQVEEECLAAMNQPMDGAAQESQLQSKSCC
eukprot:TRINITY_DN2295_c0_g1_i3.p1 TRINITY_DN2295_c0_g1~~TRINITY_DN2295_c0_g1_i3.p1  ORF type:complete len:227 (+),score=42.36 TRINITY_DN2295_c0_g1_i3:46-726(+)